MIRLLVVDDHELIRLAVSTALDAVDDIVVVGACADGAEAVAVVAYARPDVVVMDLFMPRMGGLEATRQILAAYPQTRIVILTAAGRGPDTRDALAAGAADCLFKDADLDELITAVRGA